MIQEQLKFEEANYSKLKQQPGAIPGSETFTNLEDAEGNQLGQQIAVAIQSEIVKQKRRGGLLA